MTAWRRPILATRARDAQRLERVVPGRLAGLDVAEAAAARAGVAEDHERGGAALPALADVGAGRLLADRVQPLRLDHVGQLAVLRAAGRRDLEPRRLAAAERLHLLAEDALDVHPARVRAGSGDVDPLAHTAEGTGCGFQPLGGHEPLPAAERRAERERHPAAEAVEVVALPGLLGDRRHAHAVEPARHDPLERLQVVVDVDREAVRGHAAGDVDADRADLAVLDPDAGQALARAGA